MHVLVAGGVGITPMMSMIRTLADQGDKRPVILLYGSKDWEEITFREELEALEARLDLTVVHVLENPPEGWTGERGFITAAVFKRHLPPPYARPRVFHLRPGRDDGCDRKRPRRRAEGPDLEVPFRALQLRLGGATMRRLLADRLVLASAVVVVLDVGAVRPPAGQFVTVRPMFENEIPACRAVNRPA